MEVDEKKIVRLVSELLRKRQPGLRPPVCPDEETLGSYIGGGLSAEAKQRVEGHLADCSFCLDALVATYNAARQKDLASPPRWLVEKAKELIPAQTGGHAFDLVVRVGRDALEVVRTSGRLVLSPAPAGFRGKSMGAGGSMARVEKEVGGFELAVEAELVEGGLCEIVVQVSETGGNPAEGVRVSLDSSGREQASFVTRRGRVVFDRVLRGEYDLRVFRFGRPVGTIRLEIEGDRE